MNSTIRTIRTIRTTRTTAIAAIAAITIAASMASPAQALSKKGGVALGIGLGALVGGLIATAERPGTFVTVFTIDAASFLAYLAILWLFVPGVLPPPESDASAPAPRGSYRDVLRHGAFVSVVALNTLFVFAGMSGFELLPVFAKNQSGVSETSIGVIFFVNTVVDHPHLLAVHVEHVGHRFR